MSGHRLRRRQFNAAARICLLGFLLAGVSTEPPGLAVHLSLRQSPAGVISCRFSSSVFMLSRLTVSTTYSSSAWRARLAVIRLRRHRRCASLRPWPSRPCQYQKLSMWRCPGPQDAVSGSNLAQKPAVNARQLSPAALSSLPSR